MKSIKFSFLFILFIFSSSSLIGQTGQVEADCGGDPVPIKKKIIKWVSSSIDSSKSANQYGKWLLRLAGKKVKCEKPSKCTDYELDCNKIATGVITDGTYPTPSQIASGLWEYPALGDTLNSIFIECACQEYAIIKEIDFFTIDPLQEENDSDDLMNRSNSDYKSIGIYPNPARNKLNINLGNANLDGEATVFVHNAVGQQMSEVKIDSRHEPHKILDLSTYKSGIYFLTITVGEELIRKAKFVIAND